MRSADNCVCLCGLSSSEVRSENMLSLLSRFKQHRITHCHLLIDWGAFLFLVHSTTEPSETFSAPIKFTSSSKSTRRDSVEVVVFGWRDCDRPISLRKIANRQSTVCLVHSTQFFAPGSFRQRIFLPWHLSQAARYRTGSPTLLTAVPRVDACEVARVCTIPSILVSR